MRWNVNNIMSLTKDLTKKNQSGSISAINLFNFWNSEQMMYFQDVVGRWQAKSVGKSGINTGLILNEISLTQLSPFIIPYDLTISNGFADRPDDYEYRISIRVSEIYKCTIIRPDQIPSVQQSVIDPPSVLNNKYYAIEYEDKYSFLPNTITEATLDYIATPRDIVWGFTFDNEGRQIYNPGSSVQPQWSNVTIVEITKRTLTALGVSWKDQDFVNAGRIAQTTGD